jgi:hypothetical protein
MYNSDYRHVSTEGDASNFLNDEGFFPIGGAQTRIAQHLSSRLDDQPERSQSGCELGNNNLSMNHNAGYEPYAKRKSSGAPGNYAALFPIKYYAQELKKGATLALKGGQRGATHSVLAENHSIRGGNGPGGAVAMNIITEFYERRQGKSAAQQGKMRQTQQLGNIIRGPVSSPISMSLPRSQRPLRQPRPPPQFKVVTSDFAPNQLLQRNQKQTELYQFATETSIMEGPAPVGGPAIGAGVSGRGADVKNSVIFDYDEDLLQLQKRRLVLEKNMINPISKGLSLSGGMLVTAATVGHCPADQKSPQRASNAKTRKPRRGIQLVMPDSPTKCKQNFENIRHHRETIRGTGLVWEVKFWSACKDLPFPISPGTNILLPGLASPNMIHGHPRTKQRRLVGAGTSTDRRGVSTAT